MKESVKIKVEALIDASVEKVWKMWNTPEDIMNWNTADPGCTVRTAPMILE